MDLVHTELVTDEPYLRPSVIEWIDTPVPGLTDFYYSVVAVDEAGNSNTKVSFKRARAYDYSLPIEPNWERSEWVKLNSAGNEVPYSSTDTTLVPAVVLAFTSLL